MAAAWDMYWTLDLMAMINNYWAHEIWYVDDNHTHKDRVGWRSGTCLDFYWGHTWFDFGLGHVLSLRFFFGFISPSSKMPRNYLD
jgi:hypothetical protein